MGRLERLYLIVSFIILSGGIVPIFFASSVDASDLGEANAYNTVSNVVILSITSFLLLRHAKTILRYSGHMWPMVCLIILAFCSMFWSDYPDITVRRSASLLTGALWAYYIAARHDLKDVIGVFRTSFGVLAIASLIVGIAVPSTGQDDPLGAPGWRGVFVNKNELGIIMATGAVTYFYSLIHGYKNIKFIQMIIYVICFGISLLVLYLAHSSTSIVIFMLGVMLCILVKMTHRRVGVAIIIWSAIILLLAPAVIIVTNQLDVIAPLLGRSSQLTGRIDVWLLLPSFIAERLWLGHGLGAFWVADSTNVALIWDAVRWNPPHAHEGWLDLLLELGVAGLVLLSLQILRIVTSGIRTIVSGQDPNAQYIVVITIVVLVYNISESSLVRPGIWWLLINVAAMATAKIATGRQPAPSRYAARYRRPPTATPYKPARETSDGATTPT